MYHWSTTVLVVYLRLTVLSSLSHKDADTGTITAFSNGGRAVYGCYHRTIRTCFFDQ